MTEPERCKRCGTELPAFPPLNTFRYIATMRKETVRHSLHFTHWRFNGHVNGDSSTVVLRLCDQCAVDVMLYAQGEEPDNDSAQSE